MRNVLVNWAAQIRNLLAESNARLQVVNGATVMRNVLNNRATQIRNLLAESNAHLFFSIFIFP